MGTSRSSREGSGRSKTQEEARRGRPGRHGVAVASRWPSSASTPWIATRGEAERLRSGTGAGLGEPRDGEAAWPGGRRAAGDLWSAGQEQGREGREEREREQREKDGIDSKFKFFSKISVET